MSLRDQLLKKGLVSKKDARRVDQQAKQERRQSKGSKRRKRHVQAEKDAAAAKEKAERQEARDDARRQAREKQDAHEAALRVRNLVLGHRVTNQGDHPYWFKGHDGRSVHCMRVHRRIAQELAHGNLAIAWLDQGNRDAYVLIGRAGAEKLADSGVLVHWSKDLPSDDTGLLSRDWEPSLRPHRLHEEP